MIITHHLRRAAQDRPSDIATVDGNRRRSWAEVCSRVACAANALRTLGATEGDRVAIVALNSDRYFELLYAISWAGCVSVPVNWRLSPQEIDFILQDSGARLVFVDAACSSRLAGGSDAGLKCVSIDDRPGEASGYEALVASSEPADPSSRRPDDLASLFYTGGTTGRPKGVMLSEGNLASAAINLTIGLGYDADTVYLHAPPLFHTADASSTFGVTLAAGRHVFMPRFDAPEALRLIAAERVSHITLVPTMISMIVSDANLDTSDLSSLRWVCFGAAPMGEGLLQRTLASLPAVKFQQAWGMTELAGVTTVLHPSRWRADINDPGVLGSCGQALPLMEVAIVDHDRAQVAPGVIGEIAARGASTMLGYWKRPEETERALVGGWMLSGDLGFIDEHGFLHVVDRLKDMIVSGGENVYATEVESVISLMPDVREVAVIGTPDAVWGEVVHAVVVPHDGAQPTREEIFAHCAARIANYKCPRSIDIRRVPLPLSGAGKVLKTVLREEFKLSRPAKRR